MGQFKIEKQGNGPEVTIKFQGHIDEDATFSGAEVGSVSTLTLDLSEVAAINSCGIREWIKWIRTVPASAKVIYQKCPKVIVDQINMVSGFLPENGKVASFFVPYYSDASGNEKMILFSEGKEYKNGEIFPPSEVKDDSGEPMEMDVIEAKYFKFILAK